MARRRIERLRGVQFCRRTMEIRSEVSRPPDWFRPAWLENWNVSSLLLSGFGRAGVTDECDCAFFRACSAPFRRNNPSARPPSTNEQSHGGLCPLPPRNLRFLGSSFRCRPFGRTNIPPRNAGASRDHRGAAPPPRTSLTPETHPSGQAPTTGAQTASPQRGSSCARPQPARRKPRPPRRSAASPNFAHTRNAPQRSSADHRRADRAASARQQLGAGSACQAQAATIAVQRRRPRTSPAPETHSQRSSADHRRADRAASARQQLRAGSVCQAQAATTAAQRRHPELRPHQKRTPSGQAPTTGAQTAPPQRGSNWVQAQPARRKPRPPRRSAATPNFVRTRNALPAVKRRPPARRPRRPNAAATGCRLSLPGASRDHRGAAPPPRTSPAPETHPSGQAVTTTAQTAPPKRGSNWVQAQPAVRTGRTRWR